MTCHTQHLHVRVNNGMTRLDATSVKFVWEQWTETCTSMTHRIDHQQQELVTREQQLWQRQEALWQQQLAHWQHEREMFVQREQALLAHIQELHSHLIAVTTQTTQPGGNSISNIAQNPVTAGRNAANAEMLATMNAKAAAQEQLAAAADQRETLIEAATNQADLQREKGRAPELSVTNPLASNAKHQVPQGPPPPLSLGSDDIYWVHQLQSGLMDQGYHSGEEELEDFIFELGTESAVLAFQVTQQFLRISLHGSWHFHPLYWSMLCCT